MDVTIAKVICLVCLFLFCFIAGLLPSRFVKIAAGRRSLHKRKRASQILSLLSCYGGGVFLGTCILDLIPTVRMEIDEFLNSKQIETNFPLGDFIIAVGLFIILIVEQIALGCKDNHIASLDDIPDIYEYSQEHRTVGPQDDDERPLLDSADDGEGYQSICDGSGSEGTIVNHKQKRENRTRTHPDLHSHVVRHSHGHDDFHELRAHTTLRSFLLVLALSLHSIFEGIAVGVQTNLQNVWTLFFAISIHKSILAFSLGTTLVKSHISKSALLISVFTFAIMAPIGIGFGILVLGEFTGWVRTLVNGIFQGLATGTFMYITFLEVLPEELNEPNNRLLKVLFILLGFSTITLLLIFQN